MSAAARAASSGVRPAACASRATSVDERGVGGEGVEQPGHLVAPAHRAVSRDEDLRLQLAQDRERARVAGEAALGEERLAPGEGEVAREQDALRWQPDDDVAAGVGGSDVPQQHLALAEMQGERVGEGEVGRADLQMPVVRPGEHLRGDQAGGEDVLPAGDVPDDRGLGGQQPVAVGVVAVVVGVHRGPRRPGRHPPDRGQQGTVARLGGRGVDHQVSPASGDDAGVVDHPAAVRLDIGVDAGRDLGHLWRRQGSRAHRDTSWCSRGGMTGRSREEPASGPVYSVVVPSKTPAGRSSGSSWTKMPLPRCSMP